MVVYRICRRMYANDLSGTGAGLYGGRWNPKGISLLYTTEHISLACMEYLVHNIHIMNSGDTCLIKIRLADSGSIQTMTSKTLPNNWMEKAFIPASAQKVGLEFARTGTHYALKIPSVIVPGEFNYLLNPQHPEHTQTYIEEIIDPFVMDKRLFG